MEMDVVPSVGMPPGLSAPLQAPQLRNGHLDNIYAEMLEHFVLQHFIATAAASLVARATPSCATHQLLTDWLPLEATLRALGFAVEAASPWARMGLSKEDGPAPSTHLIEQRADFARLILTVADSQGWQVGECAKAHRARDAIHQAEATCLQELAAVTQRRDKRKASTPPRWQEASEELLRYLRLLHPNVILASQLSQTVELAGDLATGISTGAARDLYARLASGPGPGTAALRELPAGAYVIWAPREP